MRTYTLEIVRNGSCEPHYYEIQSPHRIRQLAVQLFREEFGRDPTFHWHKDGFMAEAYDRRRKHTLADSITLNQTNRWCGFLGPLPVVRRGCWAIQRTTQNN